MARKPEQGTAYSGSRRTAKKEGGGVKGATFFRGLKRRFEQCQGIIGDRFSTVPHFVPIGLSGCSHRPLTWTSNSPCSSFQAKSNVIIIYRMAHLKLTEFRNEVQYLEFMTVFHYTLLLFIGYDECIIIKVYVMMYPNCWTYFIQ